MNRIYKIARNKKMKLGAVVAAVFACLKIANVELPYHAIEYGIVSGCFVLAIGFIDKLERYFSFRRMDKK